MITLTGLDMATFQWLAGKFEPIYATTTPHTETGEILRKYPRKGRKRLMSAGDCLALCLAWTRLQGSTMVLSMIFGMTGTSVSICLRFGWRLLIQVLQKELGAAIQIPSVEKIKNYQEAIEAKHPNLKNMWCTMDGLKLYLEQSTDTVIPNAFYNGWTHDHYVSAVFVFCPDGTIPIATYNVPGCFHDSTIAEWGNIYKKLKGVFDQHGGRCTVDSAFSKKNYPFLIKSSQSDPDSDNPLDYIVNSEATSMQQSAEWGMRAVQASFPRLKDRLIYKEMGERRIILKSMILLYNLRAQQVGINQILSTYMNNLNRDTNSEFIGPLL